MKVEGFIQNARILVESTIAELKEQSLKGRFAVSFQLTVVAGEKNESETLSYLDKLLRAINQFTDKDIAPLELHVLPINETEEKFLKAIQARCETVNKLSQGSGLVVPK